MGIRRRVTLWALRRMEALIDGPRDCGSGMVAGPPYPNIPVRRIVDIREN